MRKIWIDVTTSLSWNRPPVGIVRVEYELLRWALQKKNSNVCFFKYENDGGFTEIDNAVIHKIIVGSYQGKPKKTLNKEAKGLSCRSNFIISPRVHEIKFYSKALLRASYFLILSFINRDRHHSMNSCMMRLYLKIKAFRKKKFGKGSALVAGVNNHVGLSTKHFPFSKGDVVLCAGMTWNYYTINDDLYYIKKDLSIIVCFFCYDLIPIKFPNLCVGAVMQFFSKYFCDVAWVSDHVYCISKSSESDFKSFVNEIGARLPKILGKKLHNCTNTQIWKFNWN